VRGQVVPGEIVRVWLYSRCEGGIHDRRLAKLRAVEEKYGRG